MSRPGPLFSAALLLSGFLLSGATNAQEPAPPLVNSPLSPAEAKEAFRLAPGLRIDLIAGEPEIESPVHCAFDERGRLWVVEMRDYPNGPAPGEPPAGRIRVLEDRNGDGRFETSTLFADGVLFANSVLPWHDGVIVTAAPYIYYLKDNDGNLQCDERVVLYEGFVAANPQLRVSHPALGLDGWIYVANGLRGGEIKSGSAADAAKISISGKDFRFDVASGRAEAIPGPGQFGNTIDAWGRRFVCDNRNHLRHVVFPFDPTVRNKLLAAPSFLEDTAGAADGPLSSGAKIYPLTRNWTTSNLHAGRFTASCGVFAEGGGLLPEPYANGLYTCDPTGNLVHLESLTQNGATFKSQPWKEGVEFLASIDEWFRPTAIAQAPDGSLLIVDMYRAVIEHPEWMPPELKNRPDLLLGRERGRIWRIAPETSLPSGVGSPAFPAEASTDALVAALAEKNSWRRSTAQRLLMKKLAKAAPDALVAQQNELSDALYKLGLSTTSPAGLVHAAWLLKRLSPDGSAARTEVEQLALAHPDARVRENAASIHVDALRGSQPRTNDYRALVADADPRVRFETALALGDCSDEAAVNWLAEIAARDASDRWTRLAVEASSAGRTGKLVTALLVDHPTFKQQPNPERVALIQELCELIGSGRSSEEVQSIVDVLRKLPAPWPRAALAGLIEGVARRGGAPVAFLQTLPNGGETIFALMTDATKPAVDPQAALDERSAAIRLLGYMPWEKGEPILRSLLDEEGVALPIQLAVVRALSQSPRSEAAGILLAKWRAYTPAMRAEVLDAVLRRTAWINALLDAIEAGSVKAADVDPSRARRIISSPDATLAARAKSVLRDSLPADRTGVVEAYRPALSGPADVARGRELFRKNCSACHAVAGIGGNVGPDISDTRTKTAEMLLTDILNPNAAIDGNYVSYNLTTLDGRVLAGIIGSESAGSIVLKRENGKTDTVLRADVDELWSSGLSLMPEGLERQMSPQDVADVIRFLKRWRFEDGTPAAE